MHLKNQQASFFLFLVLFFSVNQKSYGVLTIKLRESLRPNWILIKDEEPSTEDPQSLRTPKPTRLTPSLKHNTVLHIRLLQLCNPISIIIDILYTPDNQIIRFRFWSDEFGSDCFRIWLLLDHFMIGPFHFGFGFRSHCCIFGPDHISDFWLWIDIKSDDFRVIKWS